MKKWAYLAAVAMFSIMAAQAQNATPPDAATPGASQPAAAQIDPKKEADINKLLDLAGAAELGKQAITEMEKSMRPIFTSSFPPGDYRDRLIDLFFAKFESKADPKTFKTLAIPVYDKYFTDEEIKGLIDYYSTPLGKKAVSVLPKVMSECQENGRQWGEKAGRDSMLEVLAEHPELKKSMEDAAKSNSQ